MVRIHTPAVREKPDPEWCGGNPSRSEEQMRTIVCLTCLLGILCLHPAFAAGQQPDCSRHDAWPAVMAGVQLKNVGLSEKAGGYDKVEVELLASEPLPQDEHGRSLFRQVHKVIIHDGGNIFTAITVNDASVEECSESGVDVFFVSTECPAGGSCVRSTPSRARSE